MELNNFWFSKSALILFMMACTLGSLFSHNEVGNWPEKSMLKCQIASTKVHVTVLALDEGHQGSREGKKKKYKGHLPLINSVNYIGIDLF
jgi:hypothetical protein